MSSWEDLIARARALKAESLAREVSATGRVSAGSDFESWRSAVTGQIMTTLRTLAEARAT